MIHKRVKEVVTAIASAGAKLKLRLQKTLVTYNDPNLEKTSNFESSREGQSSTDPSCDGTEDFSFYQDKIPGLYFFRWRSQRKTNFRNSTTPYLRFYIDESGFVLGVKTMANHCRLYGNAV
jgi:metal-dependent amidase/aminoacylase/carboxypeptidase family protein